MSKAIIGIDADVNDNGFAILFNRWRDGDYDNYILRIGQYKLPDLFTELQSLKTREGVCEVRVEVATNEKPLFGIVRMYNMNRRKGHDVALKICAKYALKVGRNNQVALSIADFAESIGHDVVRITPEKRVRLDKGAYKKINVPSLREIAYPSKVDALRFKELTGYTKTTNEDKRDAAMLLNREIAKHKNQLTYI